MKNILLSQTKKIFAYSKLQADALINDIKSDPKVSNFSLKEKQKKGETYFIITIEEVYDTVKDITADFGG